MSRLSSSGALRAFARRGAVHRFGPSGCNVADLRLPPGPGPHPVAAVIHGGGWQATYSRIYMRPLAEIFVRAGYATWNLEYRRVGRRQGGGWPTTFEDVALAIDHLATLDAPLDLDRVTFVGHSAGGHLALWAATRRSLPDDAPGANPVVTPAHVLAIAAVSDLRKPPRMSQPGGLAHPLMGGTPEEYPERYALANPFDRLPLGVPVTLLHGELDETVRIRRSEAFAEAARAAGDPAELIVVAGEDHRSIVDPRRAHWGGVLGTLEEILTGLSAQSQAGGEDSPAWTDT